MYFAASLLAAFVITLLVLSKIAKMLNAKHYEIGRILIAFIAGGILAAITAIALGIFVQGQEPNVMLVLTLISTLIVSSAAYKYINKLNWSGAFTLNMASMAIGLLTLVTAVVINGESVSDTFDTLNISARNNTAMVQSMATADNLDDAMATASEDNIENAENINSEEALAEEEEPVLTELDLLSPKAVKDIKKKEKRVYVEPKFRVISIGNIRSAVGHKIRIYRKNGNTIVGGLKKIQGNNAVITQYSSRGKGKVTMPISIAKIHKLEVYK